MHPTYGITPVAMYIHSVYPQTGGGGREGLTLPPRDPLLSVSHSFSSRLQPEHYRRLLGSTSRTGGNSNNNTTSSLLAIDREPSSPDQQSLEHHDSSSSPRDSGESEEEEEEEEESGRERRHESGLEESGGVRYRGRGRSRQRGLGKTHALWSYYSVGRRYIGMARMPASRNTFSKSPNSQTKEL